ncbi:hypothetical protein FA13DRAFT_1814411 [Coprinellus micaceus]|uniref:GST N-terminal domain-containing protein n=1 Tax=Coprinellus micaceus TaxID=71717 RepID=A0A4Y7TAI8_COPMI|nr:hypothetical protein FA13DRAFT_1814411 [Coprinellus micaceus]
MITLYDFDSALPGRGMSLFVWRVRFALNIKGIEYKTEWLNYAKLEEELKERDVSPSTVHPDGTGFFSVPAIHDPATNTTVSDSHRILQYLDEAYPNTPQICTHPNALTDEFLKAAFEVGWLVPIDLLRKGMWGVLAPNVVKYQMDEAGTIKARKKIEGRLLSGMPFESLLEEVKQRELLEEARQGYADVAATLDKIRAQYGGQGPWLLGEHVKLPDLAIAGSLAWVVSIVGEESELWKDIRKWDGGSWGRLWDQWKPYHKLL